MRTENLRDENPNDDSGTAHRQWNHSELGEAVDALERVDWTSVPTVSVAEAEEMHATLREARDELAEETPAAPDRLGGPADD